MWIENNYRRNLMDMHIDDWNEEFLSKIDCDEYVEALADAGVQAAMVKAKPHTGLCYWPCDTGRMHKGLKGKDFLGEMIEKCHNHDIAVIAYFTQIFDNWAYDNHPDWRLVAPDGKTFREYRHRDQFRNGRYGIVCPNNPDYRAYVKTNLQELNRKYDFEGMFLDMTFWPDICYCPHCRKRWFEETGMELPRKIDWTDENFRRYAYTLDVWMADYAKFATACVKEIKPDVTIEHQFSMITSTWFHGSSEMLTEAVDYSGGDYYGGFLQQTFINKYYKNASPNLPFIYHTGRCDPELNMHTTTKTPEELTLHVITALVHNGAFLLVDAINPDGSIVPAVYHNLMKGIYANTKQYEPYVSGKFNTDVGIWFASHAKYDPAETGLDTTEKTFDPSSFMDAYTKMASILRENNIPFEVLATKNIRDYKGKAILICNVPHIRDEEMDALEAYVQGGGSLYISGPIGHAKLEKLLGAKVTGMTQHNFTYMDPTAAGSDIFAGFSKLAPLTVARAQYQAEITNPEGLTVLATRTLPYTPTDTDQFAAIHSNPPGIHTTEPCVLKRPLGKGAIIWAAAAIETERPHMSRRAVCNLIKSLVDVPTFTSNAPKFVEVINWENDGHSYFAVINQQEESPIVPMYDVWVELPGEGHTAALLPGGEALPVEVCGGNTRIKLPKLDLFLMFEVK